MRRRFISFPVVLLLAASLSWAAQQTNFTLLQTNNSFLSDTQTFLRAELPYALDNPLSSFVVSGGTASTSTNLTHTISAVEARVAGYYVQQADTARAYSPNKRTYVYITDSDNGTPTVRGGSGCTFPANWRETRLLFIECASGSSDPTVGGSNALLLMWVDTSVTVITRVADQRNLVAPRLDLHQIVNVREYSARGDGATSDWVAIQAAVDAAGGGKTVLFPPGIYRVPDSIQLPSNIVIEGSGRSSVINYLRTDIPSKEGIIYAEGKSNITIRNLAIRCDSSVDLGNVANLQAIQIRNTSDVYILDNYIEGPAAQGIYIAKSGMNPSNIVVRGNHVRNGSHNGIDFNGTGFRGVIIANNLVEDVRVAGIEASINDAVVEGNYIRRYRNYGIGLGNNVGAGLKSDRLVVVGNVVDAEGLNTNSGIEINDGPRYVTIIGNVVARNSRYGIIINSPQYGDAPESVVVSGNTLQGNGTSGGFYNILVGQATNVVVSDNVIFGGIGKRAHGIQSQGSNVIIRGNLIRDVGNALLLSGPATANILEHNKILDSATAIEVTGTVTNSWIRWNETGGGLVTLNATAIANGVEAQDNYSGPQARIATLTPNSTAPSVANVRVAKTANTKTTTLTNLAGGFKGQEITVLIADANTTVDFTGSGLRGNSGVDWSPSNGDHMTCVLDGTFWNCRISDNTPEIK